MKIRMEFMLIFLLFIACGKKEQPVLKPDHQVIVAVIGNDTLTLADFKLYLLWQNNHRADLSQERIRQRLLQEFVNDQLILKSADARDSAMLDSLSFGIRNAEDEYLARRIIRKQVIEPLIPEEELQAMYHKINTEINVRQLFIFHNENQKVKVREPGVPYRNRLEAKKIIDSLFALISAEPERMEELILRFSDDLEYRQSGGEVGFIHYDKYDPRFRDTLLNMPVGTISGILESPDGFHIFQKLGQRKSPISESYENMRSVLLAMLAAHYDARPNATMISRNRFFIDSLLDVYKLSYQDPSIRLFLKHYTQTQKPWELPKIFSQEDRKKPLAVYQGGAVDIAEIVAVMSDNRTRVPLDEKRMKDGLRQIVTTRVLAIEARKMAYSTDYAEKQELENLKKQLLQEILIRRYAEPDNNISAEELIRFYEQNLLRYKEPDKVRFYELFSPDSQQIQKYHGEALKKKDLKSVGEKAQTHKGNRFAESGLIPVNPNQDITVRAWDLEKGKISDVFAWSGGGYSIIQVTEKQPGRQKSFEEVKDQVRTDFYRFRKKNLYNLWIARLREKYPVRILNENLDEIYKVTIR